MEALMKAKDPMRELRVRMVYWKLRGGRGFQHNWQGSWTHGSKAVSNDCKCVKCDLPNEPKTCAGKCTVPDEIFCTPEEAAFQMRNKLDAKGLSSWAAFLYQIVEKRRKPMYDETCLKHATPTEMVLAMVLAWESAHGPQ